MPSRKPYASGNKTGGHEAILNYFAEIDSQGSDRLFEAKVLLVGDGGVGKTSLLRRTVLPRDAAANPEDESTRGIEASHSCIHTSGRQNSELTCGISEAS